MVKIHNDCDASLACPIAIWWFNECNFGSRALECDGGFLLRWTMFPILFHSLPKYMELKGIRTAPRPCQIQTSVCFRSMDIVCTNASLPPIVGYECCCQDIRRDPSPAFSSIYCPPSIVGAGNFLDWESLRLVICLGSTFWLEQKCHIEVLGISTVWKNLSSN